MSDQKPRPRMPQVYLSTAENVARLFDLDWCIIVAKREGDLYFVPWSSGNTSESDVAKMLAFLADERQRRRAESEQATRGPDHGVSEHGQSPLPPR